MQRQADMCHRITPLVLEDLQSALDELHRSGRARIPQHDASEVVPDAYPGKQLPLFTVDSQGTLQATQLIWGFDAPPGTRSKLVFNTRIETALSQARDGRGLWAKPLVMGRCLVPVTSFYESWTRSAPRRGAQVCFTLPNQRIFLLAAICDDTRFSIVTTQPNADMAPIHSRMPLVLAPGESSIWLGPDYASLADRSGIRLTVTPEQA